MNRTWRVIDIINWAIEYFNNKNIDDARLCIELLLCKVLECDRIRLYMDFEKPLNDSELALIKEYVKRKVNREPLQYIIGNAQFMQFTIGVNKNVLIPRPETEQLVELVYRKYDPNENLKILELGCGSGCISIALGNYFVNSTIYSVDYSKEAILIAEMNAKSNNVSNITFDVMDILSTFPNDKYDVIISNPPYISNEELLLCEPEVKDYEPLLALTDNGDGLNFYRRFNNIFKTILKDDGLFFLEMAFNQYSILSDIFANHYKIESYNDYNNYQRFLIGKKINNN
ncbi:MAG TPA: peptide chain release factor N(5)-glutamine methyltransferase [Candidatus Kapabacteria bacterium]|nr:peptide chain release factor N(5)-glutamine methyltransferase [Candidatus Kapabacteria bacterium]